ncbi:hypothetical protein A4H97_32275 [Niastella yeongjuensis]|uniref:Uncharacterized protein n=1 Tax=Niastella yeongjuensis TaxID=354355 RepID=A0A1V9EH22_9BACT|nr:hypothetical protein [Niastella yeongjuensis]OQP45423.1 hypothetical protein A4H97_32275 [Niastella yeongjuensis]SEO75357.1 hypothetical protein SAMN05660816_03423 [Niastella yeongjuensis]
MRGLKDTYNNISLFGQDCDVASGNFLPFIEPIEAKGVSVSCNNPFRKNIVTCKDEVRHEFIEEVNGLDFNVKLLSTKLDLPPYIPVLDKVSTHFEISHHIFPVVGFTLRDLLVQSIKESAGALHEQRDIQFCPSILHNGAFKNKRVILFLSGPDTLIEWVWWNRVECQLFSSLSNYRFFAATGFNFSVIGGECAFAQVLNQKRSLFSANLLEQNGIVAIPHVYAINPVQITRWIKWFLKNPNIRYFTINCQLQKRQNDIDQIIKVVNEILLQLPRIEVILQGFPLPQIYKFGINLSRVHFADSVSAKYAQSRKKIIANPGKNQWRYQDNCIESIPEIMIHNLNTRLLFIENMKRLMINASTGP